MNRIIRGGYAAGTLLCSLMLAGCETPAPAIPQTALQNIRPPAQVKVDLDFRQHSEWTSARREKALAAARTLETVLNSPQFADTLTQRQDLLLTEGLSAPEILKVIRAGTPLQSLRDHPGDGSAKPITLALSISPDTFEFSGYAGFTDLGTGIIYTKRIWFDRQNVCSLAGLFAHEHMHVLGFNHASFSHPWRGRSVPYAIGDMVSTLAEQNTGTECAAGKS